MEMKMVERITEEHNKSKKLMEYKGS